MSALAAGSRRPWIFGHTGRVAFAATLLMCGCADLGGSAGADVTSEDTAACQIDEDAQGSAGDVFAEQQFAVVSRTPALGAVVCNGVIHRWQHASRGVPKFTWEYGERHTAGPFPVDAIVKWTTGGTVFELKQLFVWKGPGTHVHIVASHGGVGNTVLDPFFEYDLAEL